MAALATVTYHLSRLCVLVIRPISRFVVGLRQYNARRAALNQLCAMNDRIFDDIGVSRSEIRVMTYGYLEREADGADISRSPAIRKGYDTSLSKQSENDNDRRLAA
jgi:uncharacterized protein YjiS (DUF1127 family)